MKTFLKLVLTFFVVSTTVATVHADEIAELKALVMALKGEVESLKGQIAQQEKAPKIKAQTKAIKHAVATGSSLEMMKPTVSSKYGLDFYGYFKLDALYDSDVPSHQEIPFWVRPNQEGQDGTFDLNAKETRLGMNLKGPEVRGGKVSGKFEFDFYGRINSGSSVSTNHAYQLRTRHAYLNWDFGNTSLLAGKTWEPYIIIFPKMLNFGYNSFGGQLGLRKAQLRLTTKINDNLEVVGALLEPVGGIHGADIDGDLQDDAADSSMPVVSGKVVYKTSSKNPATIGASFVYGKEEIDFPPVGSKKTYDSWAVVAATSIPLSDTLTWSASAFKGANMDSFWGGIGQGINHNLRTEIAGYGGWTQLQYKPNQDWMLNLAWSLENPEDNDLWSGGRSKNEIFRVTTFYNFSSALTLGLEYLNMTTNYKDLDKATNDHIQSSIIFKF